jgi:hypothetical protein
MLRRPRHRLHWKTDRHCPSCGSIEVCQSQRRNFVEVILLPLLLARPFRCECCGNRFYGLALQRRVSILRDAKAIPDLARDLPVLVYGRGDDEEPFHEETNVRRLNFRGGLITLATRVAPGQQLILISLASEENQRCRVAFVGEQHFGRSMIGIQFTQSALDFWHVGTLSTAP